MTKWTLAHLVVTLWIVVISQDALADFVLDNHQTGICQRKYIRNEPFYLDSLKGCKVIEGSLQLALMQPPPNSTDGWANYSFPELREITGYLLIFEVYKLPSLKTLFPNLAVIRGQELIDTHSLVIYLTDLQEIGLKSLTNIERGSVWIVENPQLCYLDTIDWSQITNETVTEGIAGNKQYNQCPNACHSKCPPRTEGGDRNTLCWSGSNVTNCQKSFKHYCPFCHGRPCTIQGDCCHSQCLGGCSGTSASDCFVCKHVVYDGTCMEECPAGFYEYSSRRCVNREECLETRAAPDVSKGQGPAPLQGKLYENKQGKKMCVLECPKDTELSTNKTTCVPCHGRCRKDCPGVLVDSVEKARELQGCTRITGVLKISIRRSNAVTTATIIKELKENLDKIEEIDDHLVITHTYALYSLDFLENLRIIHGINLEDGRYALVVRSNDNLMELWDPKRRVVKIGNKNGSVLFHYNPKLCPKKIWDFVALSGITQPKDNKIDIGITNGDKVTCNTHILTVEIEKKTNNSVLIRYENFRRNLTLTSHLLNYEIHYKEAVNYPNKTISKYDERDPCGADDWTVLEYPKISDTDVREMGYSDSNDSLDAIKREPPWESSRLIANLKHYAWYALYVKTIVIPEENSLNNNTGAESNIIYFQTLPGVPSKPREFKVTADGPDQITLSWTVPQDANGKLEKFNIYLEKVVENEKQYDQRNYCESPKQPPSSTPAAKTTPAPAMPWTTPAGETGNFVTLATPKSSDCCSCSLPGTRTTTTTFDDQLYKDAMLSQIINKVFIAQADVPSGSQSSGGDTESNAIRVRRAALALDDPSGDSREIQFPGESNSPGSVEPRIRSEMSLIEVVPVKEGQIKYTIKLSRNLTHFTTYKVGIQACRSIENSTSEAIENDTRTRCSELSQESVQTLASPTADNIQMNTFTVNVTDGNRLHVSWAEPVNPNGVVLAYKVHIHKVDGSGQKYQNQICITRKMFHEKRNHTVEGLPVGNYSVKIQVISLAKDSELTEARYAVVTRTDGGVTGIWVLIILVPILFMITVGSLLGYFYIRNKDIGTKRIISANPEYMPNVDIPDEWEVPKDKLTILRDKEIGQGSFGTVFEGILKDFVHGQAAMRCAIKTVSEGSSGEEHLLFLKEASLMVKLDCRCHHVVKLLGVVSKTSPTCVIMELMTRGDLKTYLRSRRPGTYNTGDAPPTLTQILRMAAEIADGMAYIHKNKLVHRDLAARNCMVAEDLCVKVGDFGMTKEMLQSDYYRKQTKGMLPVRWMAPESLRDGVFTSQTDVWSFGVVLWEMATLAAQPYQGLGNNQVLDYVVAGNTMDRPTNCPDILYDMMAMCWRNDARHRPSFVQILERLLTTDLDTSFAQVSFFHSAEGVEYRQQLQLQASDDAIIEIKFDAFTPLATPDDDDEDLDYSEDEAELHHQIFDDLGDTPVRPLISNPTPPTQVSRNPASLLNGLSSSAPLHIHSQPRNGGYTSDSLQNHTIPAPNSTANTYSGNPSPRPRTNSNNNNTNPRLPAQFRSSLVNVNSGSGGELPGSSNSSLSSSPYPMANGLGDKPSSPKCSLPTSTDRLDSRALLINYSGGSNEPSKLTNGNGGGNGTTGGNGYIIRRTSPIHENNPVNRTTQC